MIARNSHLALKEAIASLFDVTSIILTRRKMETLNSSFTDAKLQGRSKKISCSCSGLLTSTERRYQRVFD